MSEENRLVLNNVSDEMPNALMDGQEYIRRGNFTRAIHCFLRSLELSKAHLTKPPYFSMIDVAQSHEGIARTVVGYSGCERPFNLREAKEHCVEALRIYKNEYGDEEHPTVIELEKLQERLEQDINSFDGLISELICPFLLPEECIVQCVVRSSIGSTFGSTRALSNDESNDESL